MPLVNAGRDYICQAIIGAAATLFNNANAAIGVGDGTLAVAATQTNLQGATRLRKGMDAGYPTASGNVITVRSTFGTAEANFAWAEWGIFNAVADAGGVMLSRKVEALGTKASTATWQITGSLTITI